MDQNGNAYTEERLQAIHAGLSPTARFPFVRLLETSGVIARESERLVALVRAKLAQERAERAQAQARFQAQGHRPSTGPLKGIDAFRVDPIRRGWHVVSRRHAECHAVRKMKEGPSESPCRRRLQTAGSCFGQKPRW